MRTVKWNPFLSGVCVLLGGVLLVASTARADVSSSNPAAIVVFPKIVVDTVSSATVMTDTVIQLTNTAPNPVNVWCFWIDANGHCLNAPTVICNPSADVATTQATCGIAPAFCQAGFKETDFHFRLTSNQPIVFTASAGLSELPLAEIPSADSQFNSGIIQGVPEDPMVGELKCIEVGENDEPVDTNDLKGEATIEKIGTGAPPVVDIRGYNGIGIQAIAGAVNTDDTLNLGGAAAEYDGCPNILIMDHFFDDANIGGGTTVRTNLTLVPCSEDFVLQTCVTTTVQFLVFNEFEGRLSTSLPVNCFLEVPLSDIGTRPGTADDLASIFNVAVQGTLTGQTWIRGVADADASKLPGHGLLGVAEEFHGTGVRNTFVPRFSAAFNLDQRGVRAQGDVISLPAGQTSD